MLDAVGLAHHLRGRCGDPAVLLGAASGIAGFCAGPILGAVLTLAAARGDTFAAAALLAVYGTGMVVPLLLITALWQRLGNR